MPKKASDERKRFWRDLSERQPTSGLNIARFCADAGVSQNAFYVWKKRLLTTSPGTIGWLQSFRRLVTRYEIYSFLFHGFAKLACLMIVLRPF